MLDCDALEHKQLMDQVNKFVSVHNVPPEFTTKLRRYFIQRKRLDRNDREQVDREPEEKKDGGREKASELRRRRGSTGQLAGQSPTRAAAADRPRARRDRRTSSSDSVSRSVFARG